MRRRISTGRPVVCISTALASASLMLQLAGGRLT